MITDKDKEINHNLLQRLIQNKCVNPPGDELKAINTINTLFTEHGIESEIFSVKYFNKIRKFRSKRSAIDFRAWTC